MTKFDKLFNSIINEELSNYRANITSQAFHENNTIEVDEKVWEDEILKKYPNAKFDQYRLRGPRSKSESHRIASVDDTIVGITIGHFMKGGRAYIYKSPIPANEDIEKIKEKIDDWNRLKSFANTRGIYNIELEGTISFELFAKGSRSESYRPVLNRENSQQKVRLYYEGDNEFVNQTFKPLNGRRVFIQGRTSGANPYFVEVKSVMELQ